MKILKNLILLHGNIEKLKKELSQYSWDIENPLIKINVADLISVLKRSLNNEIDFKTLTNWANAIESREDLDFADETMKEFIFELANPKINGKITKERLENIIFEINLIHSPNKSNKK